MNNQPRNMRLNLGTRTFHFTGTLKLRNVSWALLTISTSHEMFDTICKTLSLRKVNNQLEELETKQPVRLCSCRWKRVFTEVLFENVWVVSAWWKVKWIVSWPAAAHPTPFPQRHLQRKGEQLYFKTLSRLLPAGWKIQTLCKLNN